MSHTDVITMYKGKILQQSQHLRTCDVLNTAMLFSQKVNTLCPTESCECLW
jgi:hypothetical protein